MSGGVMWALYRVLRRGVLPGLSARDRAEMDDLIAARLGAASERRTGAASVWTREVLDVFRARRERGWLPALPFSWLDVKLGLRMLVKQPGLTCVAVFALGVGIPAGMGPWLFINAIQAPLPVEDGHQIRMLRFWNVAAYRAERSTYFEYQAWRREASAFQQLGATTSAGYQLDAQAGSGEPVAGAQVTASTFELLRVPPMMGRTLVAADEVVGGPDVVVIGHELWQSRLAADPAILGRTLEISGVPFAVVGVMPQGFRFPSTHQLWFPLREVAAAGPGDGRGLLVFGRLADGVTEPEAQAQLAAIGERMAAEFPEAFDSLRAEVVPFSHLVVSLPRGGLEQLPEYVLGQFAALALLSVACVNIGMLIFARTAARSAELAVRSALGASRLRIVTQVFTEALVLAVLAAGFGLALLDWLPTRMLAAANIARLLPFWIDPGVTPRAALVALGLAVFSAVLAGVVPALRLTGRSVHGAIQQARAGGSGRRFGGLSSLLIVADVAIAIIVITIASGIWARMQSLGADTASAPIPAERFLSARVRLLDSSAGAGTDAAQREFIARVGEAQRELVRRLAAEPGVRGVAVASALPRMDHQMGWLDLDGFPPTQGNSGPRSRIAHIDIGFFDAFEQPILAGRGFDASDLADGVSVAIVNTGFVDNVLGGRNPIGRRVRYRRYGAVEPGPWYEIVGLVGPLGTHILNPEEDQGIYIPAAPGRIHPMQVALHVGSDPETFTPRLRELLREIDVTAVVENPAALSDVYEGDWYLMGWVTLGGGVLVAVLMAMAMSGLYAIMSAAVAQRTREIGIRAALGAGRASIAFTVARRSLVQIAAGVMLGVPMALAVMVAMSDDVESIGPAIVFTAALGFGVMVLVAVVACVGPTLRALRIDPTEALREAG